MKYLVVCTGNTCRSPMAEAVMRSHLRKEDQVRSAGVAAWSGSARSAHAVAALAEVGLAVAGSARKLDQTLLDWADVVLCMESHHCDAILLHFHATADKIRTLSEWASSTVGSSDAVGSSDEEGDIPDPHGGSLDDYRIVRDRMTELIRKKLHGA